ncbi:MAG: ion transporter [Bacteroidetes bacterium]|nr:ion transporter [Bacteroidota bacterium]
MASSNKKLARFFKIDAEKFKNSRRDGIIIVDIIMLFLVVCNLSAILFDWTFSFDWVQGIWKSIFPRFEQWYSAFIHPYANQFDLIFVAIFVVELLLRWFIAIYKKTYEKWFFYPFIHWYDVLGCIPLSGGFRLLRLLRIFSLFYRLQRLGVIDVTTTYLFKKGAKYLDIIVEEVSDRVVVKVLDGVQDEIQTGSPMVEKVAREVLLPKSEIISAWISERVSDAITISYSNHQNELREYVQGLVANAVKSNKEIDNIRLVPGIGKLVSNMLDSAISDITFNIVDQIMDDLENAKNKRGIDEVTSAIISQFLTQEKEDGLKVSLFTGVISEVIESIKTQVKIKQWQIAHQNESKVNDLSLQAFMDAARNVK